MADQLQHEYDPHFAPLRSSTVQEALRIVRSRRTSARIASTAFQIACRRNGVNPCSRTARRELEDAVIAKGAPTATTHERMDAHLLSE